MESGWQYWIGIIIDLIAAIATPVSIVVAIKDYKKTFSFKIEKKEKSIIIHIINECPYPILITELFFNNYSFLDSYLNLSGYESKQIPFSYEALKKVVEGRKTINVTIKSNAHKTIKKKVSANEIKF